MRLVDSSAWIEYLSDSSLGRALACEFPDQGEWLVPTIVQLELAKWLERERLDQAADDVIAFSSQCIVAPLMTATALEAATLAVQHRLSTADAIIYATALVYQADLLTCDRQFQGLPRVVYVAKGEVH
jgi:predicted nucleic acid-binding protein